MDKQELKNEFLSLARENIKRDGITELAQSFKALCIPDMTHSMLSISTTVNIMIIVERICFDNVCTSFILCPIGEYI